ncbi:uncharacterized protein E5676_scaffold562G00330 [Cucumis melo var. makuwa]|uniref:Uncharacterized protein n=1 Tax=Cucumis melo var. makuwa TaxID=1194695 RepID=A0A5D3BKV7_CUCMM|nr:uncharacterized protein E5676_scaffold562G00330 [Cucumis melo var. makuwa]
MSTSYSMWPVVLIPYSMSPWKCMKMSNFFISLLILDPRSLGRKIDDSLNGQFFKLYAVLLWTINDFPAYGDLSEWSTKGYQACLICIRDRSSLRIKGKISFMEHRRYLQGNHIWRRSKLHEGKVERRAPLVVMNGHEILELDLLKFLVMSEHSSLKDKKRKRVLN